MAINLNPGADTALVTAATRAGLATTPADYSKTLESVAKGYEKTMQAQSKMWGDVAKLGINLGAEAMANANKLAKYAATGAGLNPEDVDMFMKRIYANKDAQRELGLLPGIFGDRETKKRLAELKIEQQEIFAEIDNHAAGLETGTKAVAAGLYDSTIDEEEAEMVNAIIKSNLKDNVTDNKNIAKLTRSEETGELIYTLYDVETNPDGDVLTDASGNPRTMTIEEFNQSITNNVKDTKNVVGTSMGTIINDIATSAQKGKSGVIDNQTIQLGLNRLDNTLTTDTDWKRAMGAKFGLQNTSFIDDLTNEGVYSADLYGALLQNLGLTKGSQIPAEGVFEGIADTDNVLGLSLPEINAAYTTYVSNIKNMKDPEVSKAVFKDAFTKRMGGAHEWGYSKRKIKPGDKDKSKTAKNLGIADWTYPEFGRGKLNWTSARNIKRSILSGRTFKYDADGDGEKETYDYIDGNWYENWVDKDNLGTKIGSADNLVFNVLETEHEAFQGLETTVEGATITEEGLDVETVKEGTIYNNLLDDLDVSDDDDASENLNVRFGLTGSRNKPWMFMPFSGKYDSPKSTLKKSGGTGLLSPDAGYTNDIMIYNSKTGEVVMDGNKRMRFKTGGDASESEVDRILAALKKLGITSSSSKKTAEDYINEGG